MATDFEGDALLCARSAQGDQRAFRELVGRHENPLRSFLRHLAGPELADELAQESFVKAWQSAGQFRSQSSFRSWLCAIGWRCFVDYVRRERRESRKIEAYADSGHDPPVATQEQRLDLARILSRLSHEERASLVLCEGQGWSHSEAADILRMPLGTLKSTVMRAKKKCRAALEAGSK